ncbi:HAD family hydrolase [Pectinatus haikarae]|uniref:hypothetical protein n=1 Tax=Pectinatus haikarae TaxID=349096 RepID=UPI0018C4C511|nr:hypothetical protein [Pectinatus haikarae]
MRLLKNFRMLGVALAMTVICVLVSPPVTEGAAAVSETETASTPQLQSENWAPEVRGTLNDFLLTYGKYSPNYDKHERPYAVFDFDNTTSVLDVEEQLMIWQLEHLAFAVPPQKLAEVLETGIPIEKLSLTYGADDGSGRPVTIQAGINDAVRAYASLYKAGVVSAEGREQSGQIKQSFEYQEFVTKMRWLYDAISETMDTSVSYPWVTYWFTGMTPGQVYNLAYACDSYYGDPAKAQTWSKGKYTSPADRKSDTGVITVSYNQGITVTPEIKELYKALAQNGMDVWINSASAIDVIRAAVKYFDIPGVKGIVAMTNRLGSDGKYINAYDYNAHPQTQGVGKSLTIEKVIAPLYHGRGPIFTAMDSQGDFNFCTEFKDTKAVLIMNRRRKDDAALCAAVAEYQKSHNITLQQANAAGDTKFVLQGRNENTGRLWPDDQTLLLGKQDKVFLSDKADKAVTELNNGASIAEVLQKNTKLKDYKGYKTR